MRQGEESIKKWIQEHPDISRQELAYLMGVMAEQTRVPMTGMVTYLAMLESGEIKANKKTISSLASTAKKILRTINNLAHLSKVYREKIHKQNS